MKDFTIRDATIGPSDRWCVSWVDRVENRLKESRYATEAEARERAAQLETIVCAFDVRVTDMCAR